MTINDYLTDEQRKQNYPMILHEAAEWLVPKPWRHGFKYGSQLCTKCGIRRFGIRGQNMLVGSVLDDCHEPDPDSRPMPCIAEDLVSKVLEKGDRLPMSVWYVKLANIIGVYSGASYGELFVWWLNADPATKAAVCLAALKGYKPCAT